MASTDSRMEVIIDRRPKPTWPRRIEVYRWEAKEQHLKGENARKQKMLEEFNSGMHKSLDKKTAEFRLS